LSMVIQQILFFFFVTCIQSSSIINIVFTVKNLGENERLQSNFFTLISSLFQYTSIENLQLHVIGDSDSQQFVDRTLQDLHYTNEINKLHIDDLTVEYEKLISPLIKHFSSGHTYYKDPLFFLSPFLHRILPENISHVIMLDIDLRFDHDVIIEFNFYL
ncbi:unnamed protein product, partial [Rotaria socialis]